MMMHSRYLDLRVVRIYLQKFESESTTINAHTKTQIQKNNLLKITNDLKK